MDNQQEDEYSTSSSKRARMADHNVISTNDCRKFLDLLNDHGYVIFSVNPRIKAEYPDKIPDAILVSVWNTLVVMPS